MQYDQQSEANKAKLLSMAKQHGNKECADCSSRSVKWACFNHGTFVCIKCSGIHRSLGRHISKVKSLTLDKWTAEEMAGMRGNIAANSEYLYNLPDGLDKPDENDDTGRRKWIERKYVKQEWIRRSDQTPGQGAMERRGVQSTPSLAEVSSTSSLQAGSTQLPSMSYPSNVQSQMQQTMFSTPQQPYQQMPQLAAQYNASVMAGHVPQAVAPATMVYQPNQFTAPVTSTPPAGMQTGIQQQQHQEMIQKMIEYQNQYMQQYQQYQQYQQQGQQPQQLVQMPMQVPIQQPQQPLQQAPVQMPAQQYLPTQQRPSQTQQPSFNAYSLLDNL